MEFGGFEPPTSLGAIQRGEISAVTSEVAHLQGGSSQTPRPLCVSAYCCGYAGICSDMQGVGHSWREVPEICAERLEMARRPAMSAKAKLYFAYA